MTRPELRDIEFLVGKLDNLVSGSSFVSNDQQLAIQIESNSTHHQKKTTNLTSWLQSDYSIFDSQPQTTKVKKDTEPQDNVTIDHLRMKRRSVSEKNILAALKSPVQNENKKSTTNLGQGFITTTGAKTTPHTGSQVVTGKKKEKEKKKDKTKKVMANALATGTFDAKGKLGLGKETEREGTKYAKTRHKSRDGSLKFLTDRTHNIFGEKFSLAVSNALTGNAQGHRKPMNLLPFKREKSISKERKKEV